MRFQPYRHPKNILKRTSKRESTSARMHRPREAGRCSSAAPSETSGSTSPERAADDDTDFFMAQANDSQSSIGVANFRDSRLSSEPSEPLPPIGRLPPEILIAIFSKLVAPLDMLNSMLVCRGWAANAVGILWHRPTCNTWANVRSVTTSLGKPDSLFNYADLIKRLNLSALSDDVSDGTILSFNQCKRIERLTLTSCKNLTDKGVSDLVEGNRHLQALDVSELRHLTDHTLATVSRDCPRLQGLNITGCSKITDDALLIVSQNCRQIKRLKLNGVSNVSNRAIQSFAENCPSILEIDLHDCKLVTSISVTPLLTTLRHLRELRLAHCTEIDDSAFISLPQMTFDSLRILDLTACENVRDDSVERIVRAAPRLRNLVLAKCRFITDRSVMAICRLGKNLHYVHLGHCSNITDSAVMNLVKSCNRIRYIDLACCNLLTDRSVQQLATLPKLRRIGLVKCQAITDQSILALARPKMGHHPSVSSLERVHLSYCVQLRMKGIHALLNSCPRLTHLSLTGVQEFLQENLTAFCREAPPEFTQQQRDVFCVFSGDGVNRLRDHLNRSEPSFQEEVEATMYDDDEELDEDEGQMTGLMNATVINDGDDDYIDVGPLNT
ncbi:Leucine-rich repeat cysteine-containing subtype [Penicillium coprophilum]|uniref:Leucine-rich repeat cysteine-containing subtype n=1 Tax=Penicillium coprophilum TaxID=36646 RepID=UPI002398730B|nr:Leucine-rich repeat cysteine-containing subtype [Penicillium coprophilum]KAJ5163021.1 Leucine-rich repeat cysteine-containing subtype [Penicillium coprophilum]